MGLQVEALLNKGSIGVVRQAAQTLVDTLEPALIFHEVGRGGIYPHELRAVILGWQDPVISGRRQAMDMFKIASPELHREFVDLQRPNALEEFQENYDPVMGGYRDSNRKGFGGQFPPTVYGTENAVNVARHLAGVEDRQALGYGNAAALFGRERVDRVIKFVKQSQDQSGGFYHNAEVIRQDGRPSIWNTQRALNVLWNLEQGDYGVDSAREFLFSCLTFGPEGQVGFRESTSDVPTRSSDATVSALNVLDMIGDRSWVQEHQSGLVNYLKSTWGVNKKGQGGFGHTVGSEPTLLYTNAVLSSLYVLGADVNDLLPDDESRQQLIRLYTQHSKSREQDRLLFGFAPGWAPNSYVMRETMYTLKQLAERHEDFQGLWNAIYGGTVSVVRGIYAFVFPETKRAAGY